MSDVSPRRGRRSPGIQWVEAGGKITLPLPAEDAPLSEWAEACRALGAITGAFAVFPCGPEGTPGRRSKKPGAGAKEPHQVLTGEKDRSWQALATLDADVVAGWWRADPTANIGLVIREGFVAVDLDFYKPGCRAGLEALHEKFTATLEFATPSGGAHVICSSDRRLGNSDGSLPDGADVRGAGAGYLVGPGSRFEGRRYAITDCRLPAPLPAAVSELLKTAQVRDAKSEEWLIEPDRADNMKAAIEWLQSDKCQSAVGGKGGDKRTFDTACMMRSYGLSEAVAHDLLMSVYNDKCDPAWEDEEMWVKVRNAYAYATGAPGNMTPAYREAKIRALLNIVRTAPSDGAPLKLYDGLYNGMEFASRPPTSWIIEGWLEQSSYSIASARSQAGKTFNELALALSIATGRPWHGKEVAVSGPVLYIASEGFSRLQLDIVAWCQFYDLEPEATLKNRFFSFDGTARLNTPEGMEALGAVLADIELATGQPPVYVVFDTLRRNMRGGVSQEEPTGEVLHAIGELQRRRVAVTLVAHHGRGHAETKGLTEWEDDADQVRRYEGTVRDNSTVLKFSKIKRGEDGHKLKIRYQKVELPDGQCTLVATAAGAPTEDDTKAAQARIEFPDYNACAREHLDGYTGEDIPVADLCNLIVNAMEPDLVGELRRKHYTSYYKHLRNVGPEHMLATYVALRHEKSREATAFRNPAQNGRRLRKSATSHTLH